MALYSRGSNPIWFMVDLVSNHFDDNFYMYTLQNDIPYLPATVYHDEKGTPWTNPIQFLANGTLPQDIFFDPDVVYRLEFRQNLGIAPPSQSDPLIYLVENYVANGSGNTPIDTVGLLTDNQITNAQFSITNFGTSFTLTGATNPAPLQLAPGWFLELTGTGNVVLTQVPLNNSVGTLNPTNAPYALQITLSGSWATANLVQRFAVNGMLWANKTVSTSITARITGAPQSISADLIDSNATVLANILRSTPINSVFDEYPDFGTLTATTNPDLPPAAYIDYVLHLPVSSDIYVTSIQVVAQDLETNVDYIQDSIPRQQDHMFNYYNPLLQFKNIPSILTGWSFGLNPAQLGTTFSVGTAAIYTWDQTIHQSASATIQVIREPQYGSYQMTNLGGNQASFIMQYLSGDQLSQITSQDLSVNLEAYSLVASNVQARVYLLVAPAASAIPTLPAIPFTLNADGTIGTLTGGWTLVPRGLTPESVNLPFNVVREESDTKLSGWSNAVLDTDKFAIVVAFFAPTINTEILVQSISLNVGSIPTRPAPQTPDEVLRECQYYYEKSYAPGVVPGEITAAGQRYAINEIGVRVGTPPTASVVYLQSWPFVYDQTKRLAVAPVLYSPSSATPGLVEGRVWRNGGDLVPAGAGAVGSSPANYASTNWTPTGTSIKSTLMASGASSTKVYDSGAGVPAQAGDEALILYHYVGDCRLGIV